MGQCECDTCWYFDYDEEYDDDCYYGGRESIGQSKGNAPRNNRNQNKQFKSATQGLSKEIKRIIHDEITKKGMTYKEILNEAKKFFVFIISCFIVEECD